MLAKQVTDPGDLAARPPDLVLTPHRFDISEIGKWAGLGSAGLIRAPGNP